MVNLIMAFILALAGISESDAKSMNPSDYPEFYDAAKQQAIEQVEKDGGSIEDSIGA